MPIRLSFIQATWQGRLMWSLSISSVKVSGIPIGLATSRHAPETETLRTTQLIVPLSTDSFEMRSDLISMIYVPFVAVLQQSEDIYRCSPK